MANDTGSSDAGWLAKIVRDPPRRMSQLEHWVGPLAVDFADGEGMGYLYRPMEPARGALRTDVTELIASFLYDVHHDRSEVPRDMTLQSFTLALGIDNASVAQVLRTHHGDGRVIETAESSGPVAEYGAWFYLRARPDGSAVLTWEAEQPAWALPSIPLGARESLLSALLDRLARHTTREPIVAALEPLVAAARATLSTWNEGQIDLCFRPGLPLALVTQLLRWDLPVSSSSDVHMSSWRVYPERPPAAWNQPHIGPWFVDVRLDGWPRGPGGAELPQRERTGGSPCYDARTCGNTVVGVSVRLPRTPST